MRVNERDRIFTVAREHANQIHLTDNQMPVGAAAVPEANPNWDYQDGRDGRHRDQMLQCLLTGMQMTDHITSPGSYKLVCKKLDEWPSTKCSFIPSSGSQSRHQPTDLSPLLRPYSAGSSQKERRPLSSKVRNIQTWLSFSLLLPPCETYLSPSTVIVRPLQPHRNRVLLCCLSWSTMVQSQLTATSASWVQAILLPQPPE
ncbi:hypothetical protein AAY473_025686 [Plecturocebus cupreus]